MIVIFVILPFVMSRLCFQRMDSVYSSRTL